MRPVTLKRKKLLALLLALALLLGSLGDVTGAAQEAETASEQAESEETEASSAASPFEINATGDVTIVLSGENILTSTASCRAGLQKTSTANALIITSADGEGSTDGSLTATGGSWGAGIGSGYYNTNNNSGNNIAISGGTVTATGGSYSAGIGGSYKGSGSDITISGGTVTATGGGLAAGIGGGRGMSGSGSGSDISISGGYITATAGSNGSPSAIGAGSSGTSGTITITGGYFGEGDTGANTVYGVSVYTDYSVLANPDAATSATWPPGQRSGKPVHGDAGAERRDGSGWL